MIFWTIWGNFAIDSNGKVTFLSTGKSFKIVYGNFVQSQKFIQSCTLLRAKEW